MAPFIMIVEIFIAKRDTDDPCRHRRLDAVFDKDGMTAVLGTGTEAAGQAENAVGRLQQQRTSVRRYAPAAERCNNRTVFNGCGSEQVRLHSVGKSG